MNGLERAGNQILEVTAYGDAAGLPVESQSSYDIYSAHGYITGLLSPQTHPFFSNEDEPGVWSDDTQLSLAVAEALITANGFDIDSQAEQLVTAYEQTPRVMSGGREVPRGWGKASINSAERIINGFSPHQSGEESAAGNGVLIKLAPLVFWQAARGTDTEERYHQYDELTQMTHDSPVARWATRVHGDFLHRLLQSKEPEASADVLTEQLIASARKHESQLKLDRSLSQQLVFLRDKTLQQEPDLILMHTDRKGFYAPQTLAMAYGVFILCARDFRTTVYEAVNLGGDTDSIASITANLLNFQAKGDIILPNDATLLREKERLQRVSKTLTEIALKGVAL